MRVALVHRFFWRPGAVPVVVREWADHLEAAGHDVVVFASDVEAAQSTARRAYVPVALRRGKLFDRAGWGFAARLLAALRRADPPPQVLFCTDSTAYFGAWLAGKLRRFPAIMQFQGWIYSRGKRGVYPRTVTWMYKLAVHFCARLAPAVACLSEDIHAGLRARGARPERLWMAPNPVDLARWRAGKDGAHRRTDREVLYVGGLRREKGIDVLLAALPALVARVPGVRVRIVGGDEPEGGPYHQQVTELGLRERVEFGGLVPREELAEVYAAADVMVSPSLGEGHALAPMECLACGTPVVASDISGLRETVRDGVNGLLVPPRDPAALTEAVCQVLGDEALLDRLSRAARPSVERFDWAERIRELEQWAEHLAARTPPRKG